MKQYKYVDEKYRQAYNKAEKKFAKIVDEEQVSNCCESQFGFPGWPDSDICSACGEHADLMTEDD